MIPMHDNAASLHLPPKSVKGMTANIQTTKKVAEDNGEDAPVFGIYNARKVAACTGI